ncbi:hypothetical protein KEC55_09165 [Burkholderia cepacia]|uniref:gas vesicle accessory protein GvpU n=1 Tax=Burkholderia cepacia TaxID=292 RepID=UPI00249F3CEC|nr:gas vesicle accessory protein GvpU [Burkholderia cepacia]WGY67036.1 hypothetical protein KEC55_09165 [Burkholderia cepacia]
MAEQTNAPREGEQVAPQHVITTAENDWFLQSLVSIVNASDMEIGITLFVSGALVSGQLVGGKHYFEGFASEFATGFDDPEVAASFKRNFEKYGEIFVEPDGTYKQDLEAPHFIHLKNARMFHPGGKAIPDNRGTWWRGRIREISGFSLGSLSQS